MQLNRVFLLMAFCFSLVLLAGIGCATKEEPMATPRPAATVALGVSAPTPVPATPTPAPAKVALTEWVVAEREDPTVITVPIVPGLNQGAARAFGDVYGSLWGYDGYELRFRTFLAESLSYTDPTTLVVKIKKGIKSHKGTDLSAQDVAYTWNAVRSEPKHSAYPRFRIVKEIKVEDNYTLRISSQQPDVVFIINVAEIQIVPKERGPNDSPQAAAFDKAPWGFGPYKAVQWERDKPLKLEANKEYFLGAPQPEKQTRIHVREASTRVATLLAGGADLVMALPLAQLSVIKKRPGLAVSGIRDASVIWWPFNLLHKPFDIVKVRQALNYALNKDIVANELLEGTGRPVGSLITRGWLGGSPEVPPYSYDPVKAVRLLEEAGQGRGFAFDVMASSGVFQKDQEIIELYASMWESIGLKPRMLIQERAIALRAWRTGDGQLFGTFYWFPQPDPSPYMQNVLIGAPGAGKSPETKELRDLLNKAAGTVDDKARAAIYREINLKAHDLAIMVFSHSQSELWGLKRSTNWVAMPGRGAGGGDAFLYNYAKQVGYGPNYEKWDDSLAPTYWEK